MKTQCPTCGKSIPIKSEQIGRRGACPKCKTVFRIEAAEETSTAAPSSSTVVSEPIAPVAANAETMSDGDLPRFSHEWDAPFVKPALAVGVGTLLLVSVGLVIYGFSTTRWKEPAVTQRETASRGTINPAIAELPQKQVGPQPRWDKKLTPPEIFEKCSPAVFKITALNDDKVPIREGTVFLADNSQIGLAYTHQLNERHNVSHGITNFHVIRGASGARISFSDKEVGTVISMEQPDPKKDIAIIDIMWNDRANRTTLRFSQVEPRIGDAVCAIGNPSGQTNSLSPGIVSGIRDIDQRLIQTTAPISPGSSGGPLLNEFGEVVGVVTMSIRDSQNLNFAIASNDVVTNSFRPASNSEDLREGTDLRYEHFKGTKLIDKFLSLALTHDKSFVERLHEFKYIYTLFDSKKEWTCDDIDTALKNKHTAIEIIDSLKGSDIPSHVDVQDLRKATLCWAAYQRHIADFTSPKDCGHDGKNFYFEAERDIKRCLEIDPAYVPALLIRIRIKERQEQYADAISAAKDMINVAPNCAEARVILGDLLRNNNQGDDARENYLAALEIDPFATNAHRGLFYLHKTDSNWHLALVECREEARVLKTRIEYCDNSQKHVSRFYLTACRIAEGDCLKILGHSAEATRCYSEALVAADEIGVKFLSRDALERLQDVGKGK